MADKTSRDDFMESLDTPSNAKPGPYKTELKPEEEGKFQNWVKTNKIPNENDTPTSDYDMRGYWKDIASKGKEETSINPNDNQRHFPDTYKTPYHKSFSNQSKYATEDAPHWINDHQLADKNGKVVVDEKADRDNFMDSLDKPVQPELKAEVPQESPPQRLAGYVTKTAQEIASKPGAALDAFTTNAAAGAASVPELLTQAAHLAVPAIPPAPISTFLRQGKLQQQNAQAVPNVADIGNAIGPFLAPMYNMQALGAKIAPSIMSALPAIQRIAQTTIGASPLAALLALRQNAEQNKEQINPGQLPGQFAQQLAIPVGLHAGGELIGKAAGLMRKAPNPTPVATIPTQAARNPLPAKVANRVVKQSGKTVKFEDDYERAVYTYAKNANNQIGKRARRWLEQNHPASIDKYLNDAKEIENGIRALSKEHKQGVLTVQKGETQRAGKASEISKESSKGVKEREKIKREQEKKQKEIEAQQAKIEKLHERALKAQGKEERDRLRHEEAEGWKVYEKQKAEQEKAAKEREKAEKEYSKFKEAESKTEAKATKEIEAQQAKAETTAKKEQTKLEKEQAKSDAMKTLYPKELKGAIAKDVRWDIREERLKGVHEFFKESNFKPDRNEQIIMQKIGDFKRHVNDAEGKVKIALDQLAKEQNVALPEVKRELKATVRQAIQLANNAELEQMSNALQATPFEGAKIDKALEGKIRKAIKAGGEEGNRMLNGLIQQLKKAEEEYDNFRNTPPKEGDKSPSEILAKSIKPGTYLDITDSAGRRTNIWHREGGFKAKAGQKDYENEVREASKDEINLTEKRLEAGEQANALFGILRGKLATRLPARDKEEINQTLKALKGKIAYSSFPGLNDILEGISWLRQKHDFTGRINETAQKLAMTVKNRNIFNAYAPDLQAKLDGLDMQANRNAFDVPFPKTPEQVAAWNRGLRTSADEDMISAGEGIYGRLKPPTRNLLLQLRILREQALEAINDKIEEVFGTEEGEIEKVNTSLPEWQKDSRVRLFRALETSKAYFGGGQKKSAIGDIGDFLTEKGQGAYMLGNQASHYLHVRDALVTNVALHPVAVAKIPGEIATIPELREVLTAFDYGGPLKTNLDEVQRAGLSMDEEVPKAADNAFQTAMKKIVPEEQWQKFMNVAQGSYVEKNFKLSISRAVALNLAADEEKISLKDLCKLILKDGEGKQLTPQEDLTVVKAYTKMALYLEKTTGGAVPGFRQPSFTDHFPQTKAVTMFIVTRQNNANLANSLLAEAGEKALNHDYAGAVDLVRASIFHQALHIMLNGKYGIALGAAGVLATVLNSKEKKAVDEALNNAAVIGHLINNYSLEAEPQESPILEGISPGFIGLFVHAAETMHDLLYGQGSFKGERKTRNEEMVKRVLRATAITATGLGINSFAEGALGTQVLLSIAFRANDALKGKKSEYHYDRLSGQFIGKEVNRHTGAAEEIKQFLTKGETEEYLKMQTRLEQEQNAYWKLYLGSWIDPAYAKAYDDGLKEAKAADRSMIKLMHDYGGKNNVPAHRIGTYIKGSNQFSWASQLRHVEGHRESILLNTLQEKPLLE